MPEHEVGGELERPAERALRLRQPAEVPQCHSQVRGERVAERIQIGGALELAQRLFGTLQFAERGAGVRPSGANPGRVSVVRRKHSSAASRSSRTINVFPSSK